MPVRQAGPAGLTATVECLAPAHGFLSPRLASWARFRARFASVWTLPMALTPSQRPTREWPLLILTVGLVGIICFPLWQMLGGNAFEQFTDWTQERWARLLLGPEQIACYCCFV